MKKRASLMMLIGVLSLYSCTQLPQPVVQPSQVICAHDACTLIISTNVAEAVLVVKNQDDVTVYQGAAGRVTLTDVGQYTIVAQAVAGYQSPKIQTIRLTETQKTAKVHLEYLKQPVTGKIEITSPSEEAEVQAGNLKVTFQAMGVQKVQCHLAGKSVSATNGACVVNIPDEAGTHTIEVKGVGQQGQNVADRVNVKVKAVVQPNTKLGFHDQQRILETIGTDYDHPAFERGAWRLLPHQRDGATYKDLAYVRGRVWVDAIDQEVQPDRIQVWLSDTANAKAGAYLYDGPPKAKAFELNTDWYGGQQGQVMYLVSRMSKQGQSDVTTSFPFVIDNSAPQIPNVGLVSAGGPKDRYIPELRGIRDFNWARGAIENQLYNTDLVDLGGPVPAGLDRMTYYYVPAAQHPKIPLQNHPDRISKIKAAARTFRRVESAGTGGQYAATYDSVAEKDLEGATYYIYAVVTDQLGNESASSVFEKISFDNHAPSVRASIRDVSPLPFASCAAHQYISDWFRYDQAGAKDIGVGFADVGRGESSGNVINLDQMSTKLVGTAGKNHLVHEIMPVNINAYYDSNLFSDGPLPIHARVYDLLGNIADEQLGKVLIDNIDPVIDFKSPAVGETLKAGQSYSVNTNITEKGAGLDQSRTFLMWNDYVHNQGRTRQNGFIGAPVAFAHGHAAAWKALATADDQRVGLLNLAVDCAGNAAMSRRMVNVTSETEVQPQRLPVLGRWDVYHYSKNPQYVLPKQGKLHNFEADDQQLDLLGEGSGLFLADMVVAGTNSRSGGKINTVSYHRELLWESWQSIVKYLTGQTPAGQDATSGSHAVSYQNRDLDPTIQRRGAVLAKNRALNWVNITDTSKAMVSGSQKSSFVTPLFNSWETASSSQYYRVKGQFRHDEHGTQGIHALVTDTEGMYSAVRDEEYAPSVQNMISAATLATTHQAGDILYLDFSVATPVPLIANAKRGGFALQVSGDGVNFTDMPVTWNVSALPSGTNMVRATYQANPHHKWIRMRLQEKIGVWPVVYDGQVLKLDVK